MADTILLHLTDLHFGWESEPGKLADRQVVLDGLISRVAALPADWRPQIVCISGDIGWKGKAADYALAKAWLEKLLSRLGLTFGDIVACAGNHDTDRGITGRLSRPTDAREADIILQSPLAEHNLSPFSAFTHFCKESGIAPYTFHGATSYVVGHMMLRGVRFVACNSAWFCKGDDDKGNLWVGLPLIRQMESEGGIPSDLSETSEPTVCLVHHPHDWWNDAETSATTGRPNTRDYLARRAHVILTGHTHGEVRRADRIAQGAINLTGGAGYSGSGHYNSFRLIRVGKKGIQVRSFEYDPRSADSVWRDHGVDSVPFVEGSPDSGRVAQTPNDFAADLNRLAALSCGPMGEVIAAVHGLPALDRRELIESIETRLVEHGACLLAGESGSGKSAVAKVLGTQQYDRVVWLTAESLDAPDAERLRGKLGLNHSLVHVLASAPDSSLVVIDGAEQCSEAALKQAARIIKEVKEHPDGGRVRFLVTVQFESAHRIVSRLCEGGLPKAAARLVEVNRPTVDEVGRLLRPVSTLSWAALRPELRELLTNLKLLDWVVRAAGSGLEFTEGQPVTLTALVDRLWERWVEKDGSQHEVSGLLLKLGELEAQTLSDGVPKKRLEYPEQDALPRLVQADLVRIRDERVRFAHDLLGDWSRLRNFVGEDPTSTRDGRERAAGPRWHRAVRLYGQRLLEQGGSGADDWRNAVARAVDGSTSGQVVSDLLLEAVFFARNADRLLEQAWPMLTADAGKLLRRLLDRFLYVATVPDDRLGEYFKSPAEAARFEHLYRVPIGPYWGPVLTTLYDHRSEVAVFCPHEGARVARLWLRLTPPTIERTTPFWWRREAAEIAITIARRYRTHLKAGKHFLDDEDQPAYEAVLLAAPDIPDEVAALCREMAERVTLPPEELARQEEARNVLRREREQVDPERAERIRRLTTPILPRGPLRPPWLHGPLARVDETFRRACLDSDAFPVFFRARPNVAVEVLLAVTIEEPRYENPYGRALDADIGVEQWHKGSPPLYFRGPFLAMLRENSEAALSYILTLVNFATRRFTETDRYQGVGFRGPDPVPEVWIEVAGARRRWLGDQRVFRWHHDWPLHAMPVVCSLMALEFWLYEELGKGHDIGGVLTRILIESESLAFAGLLIDVGKKQPELLAGPLRPLLACASLYNLDIRACVDRQGINSGMLAWSLTPDPELSAMARDWYGQPHRTQGLRDIATRLILANASVREFFVGVRSAWREEIGEDAKHSLRFLVEQLNHENYKPERTDGQQVLYRLHLPDHLQRESDDSDKRQQKTFLIMLTPFQCRKRLDENDPVPTGELDRFWGDLQRLDELRATHMPDEHGVNDPVDGLMGGLAVLIVFHMDWLNSDPARLTWCRTTIEEVLRNPPIQPRFDIETTVGGHRWDAFVAESGVALLAVDRSDQLARLLAAMGVMAFHYATAELTIKRAHRLRSALGDDFRRLVSLGVRYSALRSVLNRARYFQLPINDWMETLRDMSGGFVAGTLPIERPPLDKLNCAAAGGFARIHERVAAKQAASRLDRRNGRPSEEVQPPRPSVRKQEVYLDTQLLTAVFIPLSPNASTSRVELEEWKQLLGQLFSLSIKNIPDPSDRHGGRADGYPTNVDDWVFKQVASLLPRLQAGQAREFWEPVLTLDVAAHAWVERFLSHWFTDGYRNAPSPAAFAGIWEQMLRFALQQPAWTVAPRSHAISDMAGKLLGHDFGMHTVAQDVTYREPIGKMAPVFEDAAAKWFGMDDVVGGFARFAVAPAATALLLPAVRWLSKAVETVNTTRDERRLGRAIIEFLRMAWDRHQAELAQDADHMLAFQGMLTRLASEGDHAALALRDQVLRSIQSTRK